MPRFDEVTSIDVTPEEFLDSCSQHEIDELIKCIREYDYMPEETIHTFLDLRDGLNQIIISLIENKDNIYSKDIDDISTFLKQKGYI